MKKSKVVFLIIAALFFIIMIYIGYDISSRTTWPGSKAQLIERVFNADDQIDTIKKDSLNVIE